MNEIELIYCADGNRRFAQLAIEAGFSYGAQLPNTVHFAPQFVDQDWKAPNLDKYMASLQKHKPRVATVLDWERWSQLPEVLAWAENAAEYSDTVIIIPKVIGSVAAIPEIIGGKPVRLGYSVPTKFGGSIVPLREFRNRPVHLLGGSPHRQMKISRMMNVVSVDGNYMQMMAINWNTFWTQNGEEKGRANWARLDVVKQVDKDAPYEAFARSCENIQTAWRRLQGNTFADLPLFSFSR